MKLQLVMLGIVLVSGCAQQVVVKVEPPFVELGSGRTFDSSSRFENPQTDPLASTSSSAAGCTEVLEAMTSSVSSELASGAEDEQDGGDLAEDEVTGSATSSLAGDGLRYTRDLSDEELAERWRSAPETLGSISLGFAHEGRLINARRFPQGEGEGWTVVSPEGTWGTVETVEYVLAAVRAVHARHPGAPPLRVNQMSLREGGYFRPHRSHQNGRDVDLSFYYLPDTPLRGERYIDIGLTWELAKALVTLADVQVILLDRRLQSALYNHALAVGEDQTWLDSLFKAGKASIFQHARRHRDHLHVRFFNPRAQELGRRVAPLLAQRPDQNLVMVRVKNGDTLGGIAARYRSSVRAIQKANRLRGTFLRIAQVLRVPIRGPCTHCPVPPPVEVPPRRLPPPLAGISAEASSSGAAGPAAL